MDWMRRNWPDLLIGLALLLVIGGIIVTLLNGGNILPFGRSPESAVVSGSGSDPATTPIGPVTNDQTNAENTTTATNPADDSVAAVSLDPEGDAATSTQTDNVSTPADGGTITAVPPTQDATPVAPDAATTAINEAASGAAESTTTEPSVDVVASTAPSAPYRISVGAFGSTENAERRAQAFRDAGYPVFVADQGDLSLVLVGPYDSQAEAEQIRAQLQSSGLEADPIIYEYTPEELGLDSANTTASTTTNTATTNTTQATNTTTTTSAPPATSGSGQYLQVGAYGSLEAAAPQRSRLEGLGFTVSSVQEGNFFKLLVGPYDAAGLATAQSQLTAQGIEHFVR
jgi:cell division septation protein DedD